MRRYIGVLVVCAASALLVAAEDRSADEQKAIDAVTKMGGKITVDEHAPGKPVVGVKLGRMPVMGAGLKASRIWLGDPTRVVLGFTGVTDAGLKELAALKRLQELNLSCAAQVTDAGLKELAALKSLQSLNLGGTEVTDAGLKELAGLEEPADRWTSASTKVTDAGLKELAGLKSLQIAEPLAATQVTDAGLKELAALKRLADR